MIRTERVEGSADLVKTYSDAGMMIRQDGTGDLYSEAVDPDYMNRTYTETDIPVDGGDEEEEEGGEEEITDAEALEILLGKENEDNEEE